MSWFVDKLGPPPGRPANPGQAANGAAKGAQAKAAPPPKNAAPPPKAAAKAAPPQPAPADDKKKKKGWF